MIPVEWLFLGFKTAAEAADFYREQPDMKGYCCECGLPVHWSQAEYVSGILWHEDCLNDATGDKDGEESEESE